MTGTMPPLIRTSTAAAIVLSCIATTAQAQPARFVLDYGGDQISVLDNGNIWQGIGQQTRKGDTVTGQFLLPDGAVHLCTLHIFGTMITATNCQ
jgi:hypothetical protein